MGENFSERVRPVQPIDFTRIVTETMQEELRSPSTTFLRSDNTSSAYLPRLEIVGQGTDAVTPANPGLQIERDGDVITGIRHGGVRHAVRQESDGSFSIQLGSGENSWTRLTQADANRVSFEGTALGGSGPVRINLNADGSTEAVSATHRTIRYPDGHRTYFQRGASGAPDTLVAMRDSTGRPIQLTGATPGSDGFYNVTGITGGAHHLDLRAEGNRRIQVNPTTGLIRVLETASGNGEVRTEYHADGRRVQTDGTTITTTWPGSTGFRRVDTPQGSKLYDANGIPWNVTSTDGRITRISRATGGAEITAPTGGSLTINEQGQIVRTNADRSSSTTLADGTKVQRDAQNRVTQITRGNETFSPPDGGTLSINEHGHIIQTRADRTSTTILTDGTRVERDAQNRVTQIRRGPETITIHRNPNNPAEITQVTSAGGTPPRPGFPLNAAGGQITVDERGNITQRNGTTATTFRPDRTRVVTNTTDGSARTFDASDRLVAVRNRDGEMTIHYDNTGAVSEVRSGNPPVAIAQRSGVPNRELRQINVNRDTGAVTVTNERNEQVAVVRPTRGGISRDGSGRVNEIRRGLAGNETIGIRYDTSNRPVGLTRGGAPIEGATNISVNENTGQIQYEQNGRRFTLNLDGSSREERDFNTPHAQIITRNQHNLITEEDFQRANGNRGQRRFHYETDASGNPVLRNGQPVLNRVDFQLPGPCSLVRQPNGHWQVQSTDQNVLRMLGRSGASQPWDANVQLDANGNLSFRWTNGATCHRPADARQDRDVPATPAPAQRRQPGPPGPPGPPAPTRTESPLPTRPDAPTVAPPGPPTNCPDGMCRPAQSRQPIRRFAGRRIF